MTDEEYLRNRLDRLNQNSHYGIMIDTEITKIVRNLIKRLEDNEMKKATSVQKIENVKEMHLTIEKSSMDEITKVIVGASTNDDIFEFHFSGEGCVVFADQWFNMVADKAYKADFESERNKRQMMERENNLLREKIKKLEKDLDNKNTAFKFLQKSAEYWADKARKLKKSFDLEKAANEAQHKFIREYAGKDTEIQFNYAIDDAKEVSYVIVEKGRDIIKENEHLRAEMKRLREENKDAVAESLNYIEMNHKLQDENEELKYQLRDIQATKEVVEQKLNTRDNVNHPSHYTGRYECIDVMQDVFGDEATNDFCLCNAFKYIWRARKKNGLEDVKKAVWYLNKYIEEAEKDGVPKGK